MRGSMEGLLRWAGASRVEIEVMQTQRPAATYVIRWTE
jgi:uncharacterized protein (TIGR02265 family)